MRPLPSLAILVAGSLVLASGCVSPEVILDAASNPGRPVVIAVIDTGINAYHVDFAAAQSDAITFFGTPPLGSASVVALSGAPEYEAARNADAALWASVEPGQLYAFAGTRVMGMSFIGETASYEGALILDETTGGHGTFTSSVAAREAPDAIILMLQIANEYCVPVFEPCLLDPSIATALRWASTQPWIDIISVSYGLPANAPDEEALHPEVRAYLDASRRAHASGKTIVSASGNNAAPTITDYLNGPPWIIAVGGMNSGEIGTTIASGRIVDVGANYTERLASPISRTDYEIAQGTSFATPNVAGVLADALARHRASGASTAAIREATVQERDALRSALNASAMLVAPEDWRPRAPDASSSPDEILRYAANRSVPSAVPAADSGWGYVDGSIAESIAQRMTSGDLAVPSEKAFSAPFIERQQALREAYWDWRASR